VSAARVHLTGKEYQMLELLLFHNGTTLAKEMFLNHLYGGMDEPELKIIDVFICKLRKKLANASQGKNYIETVWAAAMCCASRPRWKSEFRPDALRDLDFKAPLQGGVFVWRASLSTVATGALRCHG
jgi:hypothetical protein